MSPSISKLLHALSPVLSPLRAPVVFRQFVRRDVLGRYRGSALGIGWAFVTPLLMLAVYSFVFVGVFKARWPGQEAGGGLMVTFQIFAGLCVFNLFSEVVGRAPSLIVSQPNLVKKIAFPLDVLPYVCVGSGLFHAALSFSILLVGFAIYNEGLPWTVTLLPAVVLPVIPLLLGLGWFLSALGVFIRDVSMVIGLAVNLLMFLSPVFYSLETLPVDARFWAELNPLAPAIENVRRVVFSGQQPQWDQWFISTAVGLLVGAAGAAFFQLTRRDFADEL